VRRKRWIAVIAVACLVVAVWFVVGRGPTTGTGAAQRQQIPTVAVAHPQKVALPRTLQLSANITSLTEFVVYPETSGYLQTVAVRAGDPVKTGQVVATINPASLEAQVAQAQASLVASQSAVQTAQTNVAAAQAQLANAQAALAADQSNLVKSQAALVDQQATYNRTAILTAEGALAQQNLDDARANLVAAQTTVSSAQAQVRQGQAGVRAAQEQVAAAVSQVKTAQAQAANQQAALQNAEIQLQYATIVSPFTGVVVSRSLDPGAYVTPGTSTPIITVAELGTMDVLVNIGEPDLPMVHKGDSVKIQVDSYPGRTFQGYISRIAGGVDPNTRTVQVEVDIPNPGQLLRPGMYATSQVSAGTQQSLVIPLSALVTSGIQQYVWLVQNKVAIQHPITIGETSGTVVQVMSGLTTSDLIVVRGINQVRQNEPVNGMPIPEGQ
jgi:RND family efflux transporter MFP subunit